MRVEKYGENGEISLKKKGGSGKRKNEDKRI